MKTDYAKFAGIAEILIGLIVLALMGPTAVLALMSPGRVEIMGINYAWMLGAISLLGLGFLINGIVLVAGKK